MNKVTVNIHTDCVGTKREGKPIMLSLDGNVENEYRFLDSFLTIEEAQELVANLNQTIDRITKGENK